MAALWRPLLDLTLTFSADYLTAANKVLAVAT
jgi:hypothetical protein